MSEHEIQVAVFDVLRLNEAKYTSLKWIYAVPNGGSRHPAVAGKLKAEGVKRGISDICIPFPSAKFANAYEPYFGAYIEMKAGKNKPTLEQKEFLEFAESAGYKTAICYSSDEALDFIEDYCGFKLRGRNER